MAYLHALVGRAHNAVYRAQGFRFSDWSTALFATAPRQLRSDPAPRLAAAVFWGVFLICALVSAARPEFAPKVVGEDFVEAMDAMYAEPIDAPRKDKEKEKEGGFRRSDTMMAGFYIEHNTTIGLQCFAWGLFFGLGSLYELLSNGLILGTVFGHMAVSPNARNFFMFVTAHGPFELTAIVFAGAAGLRLGSGLIDTQGRTRLASLRREARCAPADRRSVGHPVHPRGVPRRVRLSVVAPLRSQGRDRPRLRRPACGVPGPGGAADEPGRLRTHRVGGRAPTRE